jgi:hypothetical protein
MVSVTGGRPVNLEPGENPATQLGDVLEELRHRYVLRFTPRGVPAAGWHTLRVSVPNAKYDVRARQGYWRR